MTKDLTRLSIDTAVATVHHTAPDRVEVRFKPGCTLTVAGITDIIRIREELGRTAPHKALIVFANEETEFDMAMITKDHYSGVPAEQFTQAVAWATRNEHNARFARLYFAYFPSPVPSAIFMDEEEARGWLDQQGVTARTA